MRMTTTLAIISGLAFCLAAAAGDRQREHIGPPAGSDAAKLPFSNGVRVGDTLYVAGHLGLDPKTQMPPADVEAEARLVLDGVKATVEAAGFTMDDLVSVTVFCPDLTQYDAFNRVYVTYFSGKFPARAFIGSGPLIRGARFEVLGTAVRTPAPAADRAAAH